jgi:hypothetical protein
MRVYTVKFLRYVEGQPVAIETESPIKCRPGHSRHRPALS